MPATATSGGTVVVANRALGIQVIYGIRPLLIDIFHSKRERVILNSAIGIKVLRRGEDGADPLYRGNRGMEGWKMKNFPGHQHQYIDRIDTGSFEEIDPQSLYGGLMKIMSKETITFRNNPDQRALPMRQMGSFLLG